MILTITGNSSATDENKMEELSFFLPEGLEAGYSVNLNADLDNEASRTHPAVVKWEGSAIDDIPITLKLFVGALTELPKGIFIRNTIETFDEMIGVINKLHDFALPPKNGDAYLRTVTLKVGGPEAAPWFVRKGIISRIGVKFGPPWILPQGQPMSADVSLTIRPHLVPFAGINDDKRIGVASQDRYAPRRPWRFDGIWG